jgi:hypothetical protein
MTWIDGLAIMLYFAAALGLVAWVGLADPAYPPLRLASVLLGGAALGYLAWRTSQGSMIATLAGALVVGPVCGVLVARRVTANSERRPGWKWR